MTTRGHPKVLLMGQTPPPWHGQAVATMILFDHEWPGFEVYRLRMEFSEEMSEVGRFQWKKLLHLFKLTTQARKFLRENPGGILFYPPASAKWVPFLRDVIFLTLTRRFAGSTIFIFHASGLAEFSTRSWLRRRLGALAYDGADESLEVAIENVAPHDVFHAKRWSWCPCGIEVPEMRRGERSATEPTRVLFVGSLQEGKGVLEVLRTAAALKKSGRKQDFRFQIVGKWFSTEFEALATSLYTELGLGGMVEFSGQLTGSEKWDAYARADIFFFPTHYESEASPIVLMEALGASLPVLSTKWAGIPAMLEGCRSARLLPIRSPQLYAEELRIFRDGGWGTEPLNASSRDFYMARFRPDRFVERICSAFLRAAKIEQQEDLVSCSRTGLADRVEPRTQERSTHRLVVYLADQNPGHDRSIGIARMSEAVLAALACTGRVRIHAISSRSSQRGPEAVAGRTILPFKTRVKLSRLIADHLHPFLTKPSVEPDIWYYPKGFLPCFGLRGKLKVATIHDTIIQHYRDHYPTWRHRAEYAYWARMLTYTIRRADAILTVSNTAKRQIEQFMDRHGLARKPVTVTFEPCIYETVPQPSILAKGAHVLHLASREPHKRTTHLLNWWVSRVASGEDVPLLHLVGKLSAEAAALAKSCPGIICRPFLRDDELREEISTARALVLPSEIEGFGLPALEAYYLGTPVCFVAGTSVEEILSPVTETGLFHLHDEHSFWSALADVMGMTQDLVRSHGLKLRQIYASASVAERMLAVFDQVRHSGGSDG